MMIITPESFKTKSSRSSRRRRSSKHNLSFYWRRTDTENIKSSSAIEEFDKLEEEDIFVSFDSSPLKNTSKLQVIAQGKEQLPPTDSGIKSKTEAHATESSIKNPELNTTKIADRVDYRSPWDGMMDEEAPLNVRLSCWSPWDEGKVDDDLPYQRLTKQLVDTCIDRQLYGPSWRKRLTVFTQFCPDC